MYKKSIRSRFTSGAMCLLAGFTLLGSSASANVDARQLELQQRFLQENPQTGLYEELGRVRKVYGPAFSYGISAEASADAFVNEHAGMFGVDANNLVLGGPFEDQRHEQGIMYNRDTGTYKFTGVYYQHVIEGIPVFRDRLMLLVRNDTGYPLVLASPDLHDVSALEPLNNVSKRDADRGIANAQRFSQNLMYFTQPELVIWAGLDGWETDEPTLAYTFIGDDTGTPGSTEKYLFVADAATGSILYYENMIYHVDVTGNVSGNITEDHRAGVCAAEILLPLPYAYVTINGGNGAYADADGNFTIPHGGSSQVTVRSEVRGRWFNVQNQGGTDAFIELDVIPPGPANFVHNPSGSELTTAEVNAYYEANLTRDMVLETNPSYPTIGTQTNWPVNVNIGSNCNAYYNGSSINFYTSGGGCNNTAFGDVVAHEYGHHLINVGGSGQNEYGEGMSDVVGFLITGRSELGMGFQSCSSGIRNADNNCLYLPSGCSTCGSQIHACGQLLSGCVWDMRENLMVTEPVMWEAITINLAINSILLHSGGSITPSITIDFLTLDDDDGNINNGTPHYQEINDAFTAHDMPGPDLDLISFVYPTGKPDIANPGESTTFEVNVVAVSGTPVSGTGQLHYSIDGGAYVDVAMTEGAPNEYEATLPAADCDSVFNWYVSAQADGGMTVTDPSDAPASTFSTVVATDMITVLDDNFETDLGWSVVDSAGLDTGSWVRVVPTGGGTRGDPPTDFDGSGRCYVTGNGYQEDIDGGTTWLISPQFDLSTGDAVCTYALWYTNHYGADPNNDLFITWVSNNDGASWVQVEVVGPVTADGWNIHSFRVGEFVTPNDQVRVRFEASDLNSGSVVEAGIDAVTMIQFECDPGSECPADLTGDEMVNIDDIFAALGLWGECPDPCPPYCAGDLTEDCTVNIDDIFAILGEWGPCN